ncbi:MAG: glycosyltransferase family 4 protein [Chloroflexota bacterium]|nr:glycosyltransferase family 4 protein [Chloroflexota bacterium]
MRALVNRDPRNEYVLFVSPFATGDPLPSNAQIVKVQTRYAPATAASADGYRSPRDMWAFTRAMATARLDLVFFPSVYSFVPVFQPRRVVVTVHDVIPERFPQHVFKNARARLFWTLKTQLAVAQATRVLTVSEHARQGIQKYFRLASRKTCVAPEAPAAAFHPILDRALVDAAYQRAGLPPDPRALVYLGGLSPHKNLQMLIQVFAELVRVERFADLKLVIIGDCERDVFYSHYPVLRAQVDTLSRDSVIFTGFLDDAVVVPLLNGAQVCVLPSLDEGFGLPGIEAAACGTPVIATRSSALPELLGDAAIYIDPTQPVELRSALERVVEDGSLRNKMGAMGLERVSHLTWDASAQRVLQVLEDAIGYV